jgi:hypothetical protein
MFDADCYVYATQKNICFFFGELNGIRSLHIMPFRKRERKFSSKNQGEKKQPVPATTTTTPTAMAKRFYYQLQGNEILVEYRNLRQFENLKISNMQPCDFDRMNYFAFGI